MVYPRTYRCVGGPLGPRRLDRAGPEDTRGCPAREHHVLAVIQSYPKRQGHAAGAGQQRRLCVGREGHPPATHNPGERKAAAAGRRGKGGVKKGGRTFVGVRPRSLAVAPSSTSIGSSVN